MIRATFVLVLFVLLGTASDVRAERAYAAGVPGTAAATSTALRPDLPEPLGAEDVARYRKIFALQKDGEWDAADRKIARLDDRLLMGHVMFQRYMHPTAYRSSFEELADWLDDYWDHPDAYRIYALAMRRKPGDASPPREPRFGREHVRHLLGERPRRPDPLTARQNSIRAEARSLITRGRPTQARRLLDTDDSRRVLDPLVRQGLRAETAMGYYIVGLDRKAYDLAADAAEEAAMGISYPHWVAGLAAFRLGWYEHAARHFENHSLADGGSAWNKAAGAYWAARASLVGRDGSEVVRLLEKAARHNRTFYGILAARALGRDLSLNWDEPLLTPADIERVLSLSGGRRALALAQVGRVDLADDELMPHVRDSDISLARSVAVVAEMVNLPQTAVRGGYRLVHFGALTRDRTLYPLPAWTPDDGFRLDRALIWAFMRQESLFNPRATSSAGARGLMQLMPATAGFISRNPELKEAPGRERLYEPGFNMKLGQDYLEHVLGLRVVDGDLFKLAVAYNAGHGNLSRWLESVDYRDDPLLFIESLPARQTRIFVERVLANFWIYRQRLGHPTPGLDDVAEGRWPIYVPFDPDTLMAVPDNARSG